MDLKSTPRHNFNLRKKEMKRIHKISGSLENIDEKCMKNGRKLHFRLNFENIKYLLN